MESAASIGRRVKEIIVSGDIVPHKEFLKELLRHHPSPEKVAGFEDVTLNAEGNGFLIWWGDRHDTISWRKCASQKAGGKKPSHREKCLEAMRYAVMGQVMTFRREQGYEGEGREFHVGHDHELGRPFVELAELFVAEKFEGDWDRLRVHKDSRRASTGNFPWVLEDLTAWRDFHERKALLRMERAEDNLRSRR